jgi:hypothetical protein
MAPLIVLINATPVRLGLPLVGRLQRGMRRHGGFVSKPGGGTWATGRARRLPAFGQIAGVNRRYYGCTRCRSQGNS